MNKKFLYWLIGIFGGAYALFLLLPLMLIPLCDSLNGKVSAEIEKASGFKTQFKEFRIITTPKLTAGAKLGNIKVYTPDNKLLLDGNNFKVKFSLLKLLTGHVKVDVISADRLNADLYVKNDGHFAIEDYFISDEKKSNDNNEEAEFELPFGLKFSNKLPDIRLKEYNIAFIDFQGKKYLLSGLNTNVTDFIFNKKVKFSSKGKLVLDGFEAFNYDVKILNKIMPEADLNEFLDNPSQNEENKPAQSVNFNIIDAFRVIKNNALTANLNADIQTAGTIETPELYGKIDLNKVSMLASGKKLPESHLNIILEKDKYKIDSNLFTAQNEKTNIKGLVKTGKNTNIDLTCTSNATLKSVFEIANTFAKIAGIKDFETLSANGQLDVNFNIKSNLKKLTSNGHLKLISGFVSYGLYGVKIENLISDIKLDNNNLLINKLGFSTMGIPFNVTGKIQPDASCNIKVQTNNLPIKGLLISLGQASLLKENPISSGVVSLLVNVTDKLTAPKIEGNVNISNLNLKNIPSDIALNIPLASVKLNTTKTGFSGVINSSDIKAVNPALTVIAYSPSADINEKTISIKDTKVNAGKNNFTLSGLINDYMSNKIGLNFITKGQLNSTLLGNIDPYKMLLDLKYSIPNSSIIVIPGFDKSKITARGALNITGAMANPILKGSFDVPSIEIPEVPVTMKNAHADLNGSILNGSATVGEFATGGIAAKDIKTDFKLKGNDFYLNNLAGSAFNGSFNGDIIYNLANTKCDVKFKGKDMDAMKAIEGAAGIKNALSGNLAFNADINFKGVDYNDMMKTLKGSADFEIKNGYLANLGKFDKFLFAQNLTKYAVLKAAGQSFSDSNISKNASKFDYIKGKLTFLNAYVNLLPIELSGPSMAYYITGNYQLLNGTTNVTVLGRISQSVVSTLGNLGSLATSKIVSSVPGLGVLTSTIAKSINESPKNVDVSKIPSLSSGSTQYKDFKVLFSGGIEATSSVKSFKWINDVDTSELDTSLQDVTEKAKAVKEQINQTKNTINAAVKNVKSITKEDVKNQAKEQGKALLKSILTVPSTSDGGNQ